MDILKVKTKLMRGVLSKVLSAMIRKKTGYKIKIQLNGVDVAITDDNVHICLDVEGDMDINEFKKFMKLIDSEDGDL